MPAAAMPAAAATTKPAPPVSNPVMSPPTKASVAPLQTAATKPVAMADQKPPPATKSSSARPIREFPKSCSIPLFPFKKPCLCSSAASAKVGGWWIKHFGEANLTNVVGKNFQQRI
jgi:hypothetical protein